MAMRRRVTPKVILNWKPNATMAIALMTNAGIKIKTLKNNPSAIPTRKAAITNMIIGIYLPKSWF